jgi:hypothetical protein
VWRLEAATYKPAELGHKLSPIKRAFSFDKAKSLRIRGWELQFRNAEQGSSEESYGSMFRVARS